MLPRQLSTKDYKLDANPVPLRHIWTAAEAQMDLLAHTRDRTPKGRLAEKDLVLLNLVKRAPSLLRVVGIIFRTQFRHESPIFLAALPAIFSRPPKVSDSLSVRTS